MLEGKPLTWNSEQMLPWADGRLHDVPKLAKEAKTGPSFVPIRQPKCGRCCSTSSIVASVLRHYLVVHPRGQSDEWAGRFNLYNHFGHGFRVRDLRFKSHSIRW